VINGDMSVAQRGTSASSVTSTSYNTVDRWNNYISSLGTWTVSQDTTVPTGQGFTKSLKYDCTTADASPASNDVNILIQRFEGKNVQYLKKGTSSAESLTLSFWVRSNKTGTYTCEIYDGSNTRYIGKTYSISSADTWEKKTMTFPGDTTGAINDNVNAGMNVHFWLGAGTDFTGGTFNNGTWGAGGNNTRVSSSQVNLADSTSIEWYITGVQLEVGDSATPFEFLPYDVNLNRCLRYYYFDDCDLQLVTGRVSDAFRVGYKQYPVPMRAAPTFTGITDNGELGNTSVSDTSQYAIRLQQSGNDGAIPRYTSYSFSAEI
jgi:hypothetical protein